MGFASLRTAAFRNLADEEVDLRGKDIFLVGENGQGKSNFLEALYFCSYGSSFRGARDRDLARSGEKDFSAALRLEGSLHETVNLSYRDGKKAIHLDGKQIEDRKDLLQVAPSVIFSPDDMDFVSGSPERRRWFFDQTRSLWDPLYLEDLRRYRQVLKNRNAILRGGVYPPNPEVSATLEALDLQLVRYGLELSTKRQETAAQFSLVFESLYREISGLGGIGVQYRPSWKANTVPELLRHLEERRGSDFTMGSSMSGPHRDRYLFTREEREFSPQASTGQRRLLALLLRIAQIRSYRERTGKNPVLLLDDVLLELDPAKREKFLSVMPDYEQALYTFLPGEPYERYRSSDTMLYHVESGRLRVP